MNGIHFGMMRAMLLCARSLPQLQTRRQRHAWVRAKLTLTPRVAISSKADRVPVRFPRTLPRAPW